MQRVTVTVARYFFVRDNAPVSEWNVVEDLRARVRQLEQETVDTRARLSVLESRIGNHDKQFDNLRAERAHFPQIAAIVISGLSAIFAGIAAWYGAGLLGP